VQPARLHGYQRLDLGLGQWALVATVEKALLDLIYLHPGGDTPEYLHELRLQHIDTLNLARAQAYADSPKLCRALKNVQKLVENEANAYQSF